MRDATLVHEKVLATLEVVQDFIDTNPNEVDNLAENQMLVGALEELFAKTSDEVSVAGTSA